MTRRLITLVLAIVVAALAAPVAAAQDNEAVAVNTEDEALVFVLAFDLHRTTDGVIDESNTAVAHASCERCRTIAIAFQVVLAMEAADAVVPVNVAVAVNEECTECETLAFAYQFVFAGDQRVRLTGEGRARIKEIRKALRALRDSDAPIEQILSELQRRAAELRELLETELVPVGRRRERETAPPTDPGEERLDSSEAPSNAAEEVEPPPEAGEPPQAPVETPEATAEPAATPTPEPTATPTPETTATPTPETTATPTPETTATPTPTPTAELEP